MGSIGFVHVLHGLATATTVGGWRNCSIAVKCWMTRMIMGGVQEGDCNHFLRREPEALVPLDRFCLVGRRTLCAAKHCVRSVVGSTPGNRLAELMG